MSNNAKEKEIKESKGAPPIPIALFDDLANIMHNPTPRLDAMPPGNHSALLQDYAKALDFLKSYKGSQGTFNSYRREIERLLQWIFLVHQKSLKDVRREDIERFIHFSQNPPKHWIGLKKVPRFIEKDNARIPNPQWRPFVATVSKAAHREGKRPTLHDFQLSIGSTKEMFAILSSFFSYLLQDEYVLMNPVALIRQKSQFIRKQQGIAKIRRLSDLQWQYVLATAESMASKNPSQHERTLFMMSALYAMYLRISELVATARWVPMMNHFHRDSEGHWWFTTVGKGNKQRQIAVSDAMLQALKRWRHSLNISPLPSIADHTPLLPKSRGKGPISSTTYVRDIVQNCFDAAINQLNQDGFQEEATALMEATVHWLRHTGISDDVKHRPREHVRDDAGHSSSAITDKYIDIELRERHRSAKDKPL
jgi:site-specific recombinase XerD